MTHDEIAWWLRQLPGLADAAEAPLRELATHWQSEVVQGRTFLTEGEGVDGLYMLVEGQVEIARRQGDHGQVVVGMVHPPDLLGFTGVLTRQAAIASARASGRAVLLRLPTASARDLLQADDAVAAVLRRALLVALARRMAEANHLFAQLSASASPDGDGAEAPLLV